MKRKYKRILSAVLSCLMILSMIPATAFAAAGDTVSTSTPVGTTINLFDYQQFDGDNNKTTTSYGYLADTSTTTQGINANNPYFKFTSGGILQSSSDSTVYAGINTGVGYQNGGGWTRVYPSIVQNSWSTAIPHFPQA